MGFTVKANSEGQPGPQDFGYDHGDGANGIAAALAPLGMKVFWRTFVYNASVDEDRLKRAYLEFGHINDEPQPDGTQRALRGQRAAADQERPARLPGARAVQPDVRPDGEHQPGAGARGHPGVHRPEHMLTYLAPMWEEALKSDTYATDRRRRAASQAADGQHRRRHGAGPDGDRDGRRGQPRQRRRPDRQPLQRRRTCSRSAAWPGTGRSARRASPTTGCG